MPTVTWATIATRNPMGQQVYEAQIQRALRNVAGATWRFKALPVTSMRSGFAGARRYPSRLYSRAPLPLALAVGAGTYRTRGLVHRFDLRLPPHAGPEVVTVHDLPPARFPDEGSLPASAAAGARHAAVVICPSRFAAAEVTSLLGVSRVQVIPYGLSPDHVNPNPADDGALERIGVRPPFVIHAAGATQRKNLAGLAGAWAAISATHSDVTLLLCGPTDQRRDAAFAGLPRVVKPGRLPATVISALMARAAAVAVPSIYEGFGLPALEGLAAGAPVVAANAGALPEVCGEAALLVAPTADGLAEGLLKVLEDPALAASLRAKGRARAASFSWEAAALAHLDVYRQAL